MTIVEFARATGYAQTYIQRACRQGKIPATMDRGKYEISANLVPVYRAKKAKIWEKEGRNVYNDSRIYQNALDEYNATHGTDYSYGQAVCKGLIG